MKASIDFRRNRVRLLGSRHRGTIAALVLASSLVSSQLLVQGDSSNQVAPTPAARELFTSVVTLRKAGESQPTPIVSLGFFVRPNLIATTYKPIQNLKAAALQAEIVGNRKPAIIDGNVIVDQNSGIALLRTTSPVGVPLSLNVERIQLGERVTVVTGADKDAVELTQTKTTGAGNIGVGNGCFIDMDRQAFKNIGGPVINSQGKVIGILVDRPEPNKYLISAASVLAITQLIGSENKKEQVGTDVSSGLPGETGMPTPKTPCSEFLFGSSSVPPPAPPPPETKEELPKIIRRSGGVLQESARKRVAPEYPPNAKAAGVSGSVVVEILVDESGNVISARALSGHELLRDVAVAAARQWKFKPVKLSGVPVKVIGTLTFNFNL